MAATCFARHGTCHVHVCSTSRMSIYASHDRENRDDEGMHTSSTRVELMLTSTSTGETGRGGDFGGTSRSPPDPGLVMDIRWWWKPTGTRVPAQRINPLDLPPLQTPRSEVLVGRLG